MKNTKLNMIILITVFILSLCGCNERSKNVLSYPANVNDIIAGGNNIFILTDENEMYSYGFNLYGQLGIDINTITDIAKTKEFTVVKPTFIKGGISDVASGEWHSLVLDNNNSIYSFGNNRYGQLGNENISDLSPVMDNAKSAEIKSIDSLANTKIKKIVAYWMNSACLDYDNNLYIWGNNEYGQIGNGNIGDLNEETRDQIVANPSLIMKGIRDVSIGKDHIIILNNHDQVYALGSNDYSQLGVVQEYITSPKKILDNIKYINAAHRSSFFIDMNDNLLFCGDDRLYGITENDYLTNPQIVRINVQKVYTSINFLIIKYKNNKYEFISKNRESAIITNELNQINQKEEINSIATGDEFAIIKTNIGNIYGYGDNKYDQLNHYYQNNLSNIQLIAQFKE